MKHDSKHIQHISASHSVRRANSFRARIYVFLSDFQIFKPTFTSIARRRSAAEKHAKTAKKDFLDNVKIWGVLPVRGLSSHCRGLSSQFRGFTTQFRGLSTSLLRDLSTPVFRGLSTPLFRGLSIDTKLEDRLLNGVDKPLRCRTPQICASLVRTYPDGAQQLRPQPPRAQPRRQKKIGKEHFWGCLSAFLG